MDTMTNDGNLLLSSNPNDAFLCNVNQSTAAAAGNSHSTTGDFGTITPTNETMGVKTIEIFENGVKRVIIVPILLPSSNLNSVGTNAAVFSNGSTQARAHLTPNNVSAADSRTLVPGTSATFVTVSSCGNNMMPQNTAVDVKNFARLQAITSHVCSSATNSRGSLPQTVTAVQSCSQQQNLHPAFRSSSLSTSSVNNRLVSSQCQTYGGLTLPPYNNRPNESLSRTLHPPPSYCPQTSLTQGQTLAAGSYVPYSAASGTLPLANVSNNMMQLPYVQQFPNGQQNCVSLPSNTGLLQQTFSNSFAPCDVPVNPQLINNGAYAQVLMPRAQATVPWPNVVQGTVPASNHWPMQFLQPVSHSTLNVNYPAVNTIQFVPSLPTSYNTAPMQLHTVNYFQPTVQHIPSPAPQPHVGKLAANSAVELVRNLACCIDPAPVRLEFPAACRTSDQGLIQVRNNGATSSSQLPNCMYNIQQIPAADVRSTFPAAGVHSTAASTYNFDRFNYSLNHSNANMSAAKVQTAQPMSSSSQQNHEPPGYFSQFRVCKNILPLPPVASSEVGMLGSAAITQNGVHSAPAVRPMQQTSRRHTGRTDNTSSQQQTRPPSVTLQSADSPLLAALRAPPPLRMAIIRNDVKSHSALSSTLGLASSIVANTGNAGLNPIVARSISDVPRLQANPPTETSAGTAVSQSVPVTAKAIMESAVGSPGGESSNDIGSIPPEVIDGAESEALLVSFCTFFDPPAHGSLQADRLSNKPNLSGPQPTEHVGNAASSTLPVATQSVAGVTAAEAARALSFAKSLGKGKHHAEQVKARRQAKQTKRRSHLTSLEVNDDTNSSDSWHPDSASVSSYELSPGLYDDVVEEALSSSDSWSSRDSVTIGRSSHRRRKRSPGPRKRRSRSWRQRVRDQAVTRRSTRWRHEASPKHDFLKLPECYVLLERLRLNGQLSVSMNLVDSVVCCPRTNPGRRIIDSEDDTLDEQPSVKRTRILRIPSIEDTEVESS